MTESTKPIVRAEDNRLILNAEASVPEAFEAGVAHGMGISREALSKKINSAVAQRNASITVAVGTLIVSNWQSIKIMSSSLKKKYDERREAKRKETE
nr:MAG TPA: replisome organizer [Caudoviricetes sp.]